MELQAIYSSQKSFYKKAILISEGLETKLKSYDTIVAVKQRDSIKINGYFSKTTAIHINEFLMQSGCSKLSKKQMDLQPTINFREKFYGNNG